MARPRLTAALRRVLRLLGDERGATAVEYGLIVSLIVISMIGAFIGVANSTSTLWNNISDRVQHPH